MLLLRFVTISFKSRNYQFMTLALASALATIPIWIAHYPMMVDLPQHAMEIALLRNIHDPMFRFGSVFEYHWFTPYWLGYLIVYTLAPALGIATALKVVVSLSLASIPLATAILSRELGADPRWAWLTIPGIYGFAYQWGFLNFIIAVPLGILFLALAVWYTHSPTVSRAWILAAATIALFFCHALICALCGLIAALCILVEAPDVKSAFRNLVPLMCPLPLMAYYLGSAGGDLPVPVDLTTHWSLAWFASNADLFSLGRMNGFFPRILGFHSSLLCLLVGLLLVALPLLAGARGNPRRAAWIPLCVLIVALLFMPSNLRGNAFTYERLAILVLPFFALIWTASRPGRASSLFWPAAIAASLIWAGISVSQAQVFREEQAGFQRIVQEMAPNERVMSLMIKRSSAVGIAPLFQHFPAWYAAERGGIVDPSFASFGIEPVRFRRASVPAAVAGTFDWHPGAFEWNQYRGRDYRYFVVYYTVDVARQLFRHATCDVKLVDHVGLWWLYETDPACHGEQSGVAGNAKEGELSSRR